MLTNQQCLPIFSQISGVILAAGLSRRAAPHNKLLLPAREGMPVIRCVADAFCHAGLGEVIAVVGHQREQVEQALAHLPIRIVFAPKYELGMGFSLAAAVRAAVPTSCGFLVSPGDLPRMSSGLVQQIADEFVRQNCVRNIVPENDGQPGHPVALVSALRPKLEGLKGDFGAKRLLAEPAEALRTIYFPISDDACRADNDGG